MVFAVLVIVVKFVVVLITPGTNAHCRQYLLNVYMVPGPL